MENKNIYEQKTEDVKKMLKDVNHKILKLSKIRYKMVIKPDLKLQELEKSIASTKEEIQKNEAAFIELCKNHFDKIFFYDDKMANDPSMKNLLARISYRTLFFRNTDNNEQKTVESYLEEFHKFIKLTFGNENGLFVNEKSSLYNILKDTIAEYQYFYKERKVNNIKELNKLEARLVFVEKLRIFKRAKKSLIQSINLKNTNIIKDAAEAKNIDNISKMLDTSFESLVSLNEIINSKTTNCYTRYKFYKDILSKQLKYKKELVARLKINAPQTEEIATLKSKATLQEIIEKSFDKNTLEELAQHPDVLIYLGKASEKRTGDSVEDNLLVPYLIEKYEKPKEKN